MKTLLKISALVSLVLFLNCNPGTAQQTKPTAEKSSTKIQVAILLDASNSMDGLIEQAKSRLWNIVNALTTLRFEGKLPQIEIALYMYGNDGIPAINNYIRQLTPFTGDLDLISEKLFAIRTNGGSEYCGTVINEAVKKLDWGREKADMRLIYIAGNEPFTQGNIAYNEAIGDAIAKDIYVNTIFCGNYDEGVNTFWKDGADKGKGQYFNINSNAKVIYITTPYDVEIQRCNERLNKTYIYYGSEGYVKYQNQAEQDKNSLSVSAANYTERSVSKSNSVYKNDNWDLVDKVAADSTSIAKVNKKDLPKEYQNMNTTQLKAEVEKMTKEREQIQKEIAELAKKRQEYINNQNKTSTSSQDDLGNAINVSIMNLAKNKGYSNQ